MLLRPCRASDARKAEAWREPSDQRSAARRAEPWAPDDPRRSAGPGAGGGHAEDRARHILRGGRGSTLWSDRAFERKGRHDPRHLPKLRAALHPRPGGITPLLRLLRERAAPADIAMSSPDRADRLAQVRSQVSYHRQRLTLYRRLHGSGPSARLAELEHACADAERRLAYHMDTAVTSDQEGGPGPA